MAKFDSSNWADNKLAYLAIILAVIVIVIYVTKNKLKEGKGRGIPGRTTVDGNGTAYYYARGSKDDSTAELLDRIDWASYLEKRTTLWYRIVPIVIIVIALIAVLVMRKLPSPSQIIMLFVTIFIPFYASHQLYYVHGDAYNDYYIKHNVDLIRRKLGLSRNDPPEPVAKVPRRTKVMNPK